jgi:hypothetical protein
MGQYQIDFKRKIWAPALNIDQTRVDRLLQIEQKYKSRNARPFRMPRRRSSSSNR